MQEQVFWRCDDYRRILLLWRRQLGKTTTLSSIALRRMLQRPNHLITYASASLLVGQELIHREASLFFEALKKWREIAELNGYSMTTEADGLNIDDLDIEDFEDIFSQSKLEVKIHHDNTSYSRTQIIAPNPATARGFTGDVMIDEIGFIKAFRELEEAMEPISSRDPTFRLLMATTIPEDDSHLSWEMALPPDHTEFEANPEGHWYRSQMGVLIHRADVYDAWEAGVKLYDADDGSVLTPEQHRAKAINRAAWDRNYWLKFLRGGTSAVSRQTLYFSQEQGKNEGCEFFQDTLPSDWRRLIVPDMPICIGYDVATTTSQKSNPTSFTFLQQFGMRYQARFIFVTKTDDEDEAEGHCIELCTIDGMRVRSLVIDGSNEKFFAQRIRKTLSSLTRVIIYNGANSSNFRGEKMTLKQFTGNTLINAADDGLIALPPVQYILDDWRLVKKERGQLDNEVASDGKHGDTFDSTKLALFGFTKSSGKVEARAVAVGGVSKPQSSEFPNLRPTKKFNYA